MERRSWPWRSKKNSHKSLEKSTTLHSQPQFVSPASSFNSYEAPAPSTRAVPGQEIPVRKQGEDIDRISQAVSLREQAEEKAKTLAEKLTAALEEVAAKDEAVKQHQKIADDSIAGWEKAQKEILSLRTELEVSAQQKSVLEDRVAHLDGALKECMKQVRLVREEQEAKTEEAVRQNTQEWQKLKAEMMGRQTELERRLMESEAQNNAMTRSLQERARTIVETTEAKARAETQAKVSQVKIDSLEKELSALKYELHVLNKELQIRNEEREYSKKTADAAHKQHLENVKKIAKLESDCQRLRTLVKKKLPGPAALAQMRKEVEGAGRESWDNSSKARRRSLGSLPPSPANSSLQDFRHSAREIELLRDRMMCMEEETKLLKEALAKKNGDLLASRLLCAKTASKLSVAEDQLESLQGTPRESIRNGGFDLDAQTEASIASMSEDGCIDVEEASCAESWASALITELAHFKKATPSQGQQQQERQQSCDNKPQAKAVTESCETMKHEKSGFKVSSDEDAAGKVFPPRSKFFAQLKAWGILCKDANLKLSAVELQLRAQASDNSNDHGLSSVTLQESLQSLTDAHVKVSEVEEAITRVLNVRDVAAIAAPANHDSVEVSNLDEEKIVVENQTTVQSATSSLRFVLCKLIFLLEMLRPPHSPGSQEPASTKLDQESVNAVDSSKLATHPHPHLANLMRDLVSAKESILEGRSSVLEFLLRLGVVLSALCDYESSELQRLITKSSFGGQLPEEMHYADNGADESNGHPSTGVQGQVQLDELRDAKTQLEERLAAMEGELHHAKTELAESRQLVSDLQGRLGELQDAERRLAEEQATKGEVQAKLDQAEAEVAKLQASVVSLTSELAEQRMQYEGAAAKCEELEQRLQGLSIQDPNSGCKVVSMDDDEAHARKEREVAAAREKLAECQRTILVLGQQLTALSSPPGGSSFDSASMAGHVDVQSPATPLQEEQEDDEFQLPVHSHQPQQNGRRVQHLHEGGGAAVWGHRQRGANSALQENGGLPPPFYSSGPAQAEPAHFHNRAHPYHPDRGGELGVRAFSPSHVSSSVMSSPARSPAHYLQMAGPRHLHPGSSSTVRTSLTRSMNRAAAPADAAPPGASSTSRHEYCSPSPAKPPKSTSSFGRLFSRSKNRAP